MANSNQQNPSSGLKGFRLSKTIRQAKVKEFTIIDDFKLGYRNREDITKLPPGVLIVGSQNVLTDVTGRVGITKGYVLDGPPEVPITGYILQENGGLILQENGGKIIIT